MRNQVDSFGNATRDEDYFFNVFSVYKVFCCLAGCFVRLGGFLRQGMNAPVNVGVVTRVIIN
jgi:hypothetical protein